MEPYQIAAAGLLAGYLLDLVLGDPLWLPHPIVYFGKAIAKTEKLLRKGKHLLLKGAIAALLLVAAVFCLFYFLMIAVQHAPSYIQIAAVAIIVFYGLANRTLITEVRNVFTEVDKNLELGRKAVGRIVGRDTTNLSAQQIRKAALETLSENLSDGVVAPLFYFGLFGVPGIMAYKMVNTLDSMWGYKNERYLLFGRTAARLDDIANFVPARITALLMALVAWSANGFRFIAKFGSKHTSPNSGYPEAALAGILGCQFGGGSHYGGTYIAKPAIGYTEREFTTHDMTKAVAVNQKTTLAVVITLCAIFYLLS